jgi:hypothetical protein
MKILWMYFFQFVVYLSSEKNRDWQIIFKKWFRLKTKKSYNYLRQIKKKLTRFFSFLIRTIIQKKKKEQKKARIITQKISYKTVWVDLSLILVHILDSHSYFFLLIIILYSSKKNHSIIIIIIIIVVLLLNMFIEYSLSIYFPLVCTN